MNARLLILLAGLLAVAAAGRAADNAETVVRFGLVPPDYKHPVAVPATVFNPFKIQAVVDAESAHHEVANISNDKIVAALSRRGLSGVLLARAGGVNRVIIGDDVFAVGDEVQFAAADGAPLVAGASIVLRKVEGDKLTFEVTPAGEPARTLTYPLRGFLRP